MNTKSSFSNGDINKKFDEFIKSQNEKNINNEKFSITPEQEKELWLKKISELYSLVDDSLEEYVSAGNISIKKSSIRLQEEQIGSYSAETREIVIGRQLVRLEPIGTYLIGARGRIDMVGPNGTVKFVIVPPTSDGPKINVSVSIGGQPIDRPKTEYVPPEKWVWKIATLPPRIMYLELTPDSFREALMGVVNGND